ncbi:hypothetical protein DPMN_137351 [Dreissena polymorpha]|uniref:Uncharacterized protein n=1 Tax=Dreissena polymorpha TaxID=45954 RepID=A0A9D4G1N8_DREPO|nr:hypothetical protein DPMN_137351 [Dreissena polymorpha]
MTSSYYPWVNSINASDDDEQQICNGGWAASGKDLFVVNHCNDDHLVSALNTPDGLLLEMVVVGRRPFSEDESLLNPHRIATLSKWNEEEQYCVCPKISDGYREPTCSRREAYLCANRSTFIELF